MFSRPGGLPPSGPVCQRFSLSWLDDRSGDGAGDLEVGGEVDFLIRLEWAGVVLRDEAIAGGGIHLRLVIDAGCDLPREDGLRLCKSGDVDRKSTRLNSSHANISYA